MSGRLKTEIADQATKVPFAICRVPGDDVQVALQPLPRGQGLIVQGLFDKLFGAREIAIEDLSGKGLFAAKMIGEAALRRASAGADVTHSRRLVAYSKHYR